MQDTNFNASNNFEMPEEKPTFLIVLCVITFIVSGLMLIYSVFDMSSYTPEKKQNQIEEQILMSNKLFSGFITDEQISDMRLKGAEEIEHFWSMSLAFLASVVLSILGGFFMYQQKKIGFHIYIVSKIIGVSIICFYTMTQTIMTSYIQMGVASLIFVILYAVNLKHME